MCRYLGSPDVSFEAVEGCIFGLVLETRVFRVVGLKPGDECMLGLPHHHVVIVTN